MILDTETTGAATPATTEMPASTRATANAKQAKPKAMVTTKPAKAKAVAVKVVDDAPAAPSGRRPEDFATPEELVDEAMAIIAETQRLAARAKQTAAAAIGGARRAGELFLEAKGRVGHGNWELWIGEHVPGLSKTTVWRYMELAKQILHVKDLEAYGSLSALYRDVGILPEKTRGQGKAVAKSEGKGKAEVAINDARHDAGGAEAIGHGASSERDDTDAVPARALRKSDNPAPESSGPTTTGDAEDEPRTARPSVDGVVRAAVGLREMIGLIWEGGVKLTPAQSRELHATEMKLRRFREAMGGSEGKALSEEDHGRRK